MLWTYQWKQTFKITLLINDDIAPAKIDWKGEVYWGEKIARGADSWQDKQAWDADPRGKRFSFRGK